MQQQQAGLQLDQQRQEALGHLCSANGALLRVGGQWYRADIGKGMIRFTEILCAVTQTAEGLDS